MKLFARLLIILTVVLISHHGINAQEKKTVKAATILLAADRAFAQMAAEKTPRAAFEFYMAEDVIFVPVGETLMTERQKIIDYFADETISQIRWKPLRAEVSKSNDLGFTYGVSEMSFRNEDGTTATRYYNYVSVWRKNKRGEWKMIVDMGNSHPAAEGMKLFGK